MNFKKNMSNEENLIELKRHRAAVCEDVVESSVYLKAVAEGISDRRIYAMGLIETYHVTAQTPTCLALTAASMQDPVTRDRKYMKYCLKQAIAEFGHELFALDDLRAMGLDIREADLPPPLPATELFLGFAFRLATAGEPLARLGHAFWIESWFEISTINEKRLPALMNLQKNERTFIDVHVALDGDAHADGVEEALLESARTPEQWSRIAHAMEASFRGHRAIYDNVYREYLRLKSGAPSRYAFLASLK